MWGAALVLIGMLASTLASPDPDLGIRQVLVFLIGSGLLISVVQSSADPAGPAWIMRAWVMAFVVAVLPSLSSPPDSTGLEQGGGVVRGRIEGVFTQPNYLGELCLLTVFVAVALLLSQSGILDRILAVFGCVLAIVTMALSLSRGSFIGLIVGAVVVCLLVPRLVVRVAVAGGVLVSCVLVLWLVGNQFVVVLIARLGSISAAETNPQDSRALIWGEAVRLWSEHQLFGVGLGRYLAETQSAGSDLAPAGAWHAHNVILHAGVETGVLGMATLVAAAIVVVFTVGLAWGSGRALILPRRASAALLAGLFGAAAHGAVDFVYSQPVLVALLGVYVGLLAAGCLPKSEAPPARRDPTTALSSQATPTSPVGV